LSNALQLWILDLITWSAIQDLGMSLLRKRKERDWRCEESNPMVCNSGLGIVFTAKKKKERDIGDVRSRTPCATSAVHVLVQQCAGSQVSSCEMR
jgi:hypothetical protein